MDILTADPDVVAEQLEQGCAVYRNVVSGRRWRVKGTCDRRGDCLIGAVIDGVVVRDHAHLADLARTNARVDSHLDVPLGPGYDGSCCPMEVEQL